MATIVTRSGKGSPLTSAELDQNQINLNTDKAELSGATFTGAITANAGVVVDNITIDGNEIDVSSGNFVLDVAGEIELDADGGKWIFLDGGTQVGRIENSSSDFVIKSSVNNKDIKFNGEDGGSNITALTLDMSDFGGAIFNSHVTVPTDLYVGQSIIHNGDSNTSIAFQPDVMDLYSGGLLGVRVQPTAVTINEAGADADFRVESSGNDYMLFVQGVSNRVYVGGSTNVNTSALQVTGQAAQSALVTKVVDNNYSLFQGFNASNALVTQITGAGVLTHNGAATFSSGLTLTDGNLVVANGHGIDFSATSGSGTSELLDDYEEGTWTPGITHGTTAATVTDLGASGSYTKIGRMVTLNGNVKVATVNGNGAALLTGFPFTVGDTVAGTGVESSGIISYYANWGDNVNSLVLATVSGNTYGEIYGNHNASGVNSSATTITQAELDSPAEFRFSIQYFTA